MQMKLDSQSEMDPLLSGGELYLQPSLTSEQTNLFEAKQFGSFKVILRNLDVDFWSLLFPNT